MSRPPVRVVSDCWDWITREEVAALAVAAFEAACLARTPPDGEPFLEMEEGREHPWTSRGDLCAAIPGLLAQRLNVLAIERGVPYESGITYPELPPGYEGRQAGEALQ